MKIPVWAYLMGILGLLAHGSGIGSLPAHAQPNLQRLYTGKEKPADYGIRSAKAMKLYHAGLDALRYSVKDAQARFAEAVRLEPDFAAALCQLGNTLYQLKRYTDAREPLSRGTRLKPGLNLMAHLHYGRLLLEDQRYPEAREQFRIFIQKADPKSRLYAEVRNDLQKVEFAAYWVEHPVQFKPQNMGPAVNSPGEDVMPTLTADERLLFFASRREGSLGGFNRLWNDFDEDFFVSERQADGSWGPARRLEPPINTPENEGSASISMDGREVYFTACDRPTGQGSCDLYRASYQNGKWTQPQNLGPVVNSPHFDSQPALSHDGRKLYFASTRPGGKGGSDLWVSYRQANGNWGPPRNLGDSLNTPQDEYNPFLHADGVSLYFSSNGHIGFGGFDLFRATSLDPENEKWAKPQNLGYPLNTGAEERSLFVNAEGTRGYLNTNRMEGGLGKNDLYWFELDPRQRPKPATYVRGFVLDSLSKQPLEAEILFVDVATGDTLRRQQASEQGRFLLTLPLERDYAAFVQHPGYLFASKAFRLKADSAQTAHGPRYFDLRLPLLPIAPGSIVRLDNIFFDFDQSSLKAESEVELNKLLQFLQNHPRVCIELRGHTDSEGADSYNLKLSEARAQAVRTWLVNKGIAPKRLQAKGYGETIPVADNSTSDGRAQNRRTEFVVTEIEEAGPAHRKP